MKAAEFLSACMVELELARTKHPRRLADPFDGLGVILEELDEFWDEVRKQEPDTDRCLEELAQTGAMVMRLASEVNGWDSRELLTMAAREAERHVRVPSWHAVYAYALQALMGEGRLAPHAILATLAKAVECITETGGEL